MDRPNTEAPQTQIYFITHWSGAFLEVRLRTVVCGERASWSIVNSTTAAWFLGVVESLVVVGLGLVPVLKRSWGRGVSEARGDYGTVNRM